MARTRNTDKIQKRLKEEAAAEVAKAAEEKEAARAQQDVEEEKEAASEDQPIAGEEKAVAPAEEEEAAAEDEEAAPYEEQEAAAEERSEVEEDESESKAEEVESGEDEAEVEEETAEEESGHESERGDQSSGSSVSSRKRSASESSDKLRYVPALKKHHKSWASFEAYLKTYEKRTNTVLVITETLNVRLRNQRLKKQKRYQNKPDSEIPLVPETMDPFQRLYICTHGWKVRTRSTGVRPVQRVTFTGCKVRFVAQLYERSAGKWWIEVKLEFYGHNHHVSEEVFRSYPSIRMIPDDSPIMSNVEMLVNNGSKASRVYDYIRDNSIHRVRMRDVYNLVTRIKGSGDELSDQDQVAELLVNFNLVADGNVSSVNENARGQTAVISISSQHMRKLYHRFPELLLIDCTHKTNRYNYQLCTFMVMDQFGNGQPVQHSVIERNADWHMVKTVEHFQAVNEWEATRVIVVDKDLKEIEVLTRMFPDAHILLCHFHVIKWLASAVRDDKKYGTYPSDVLRQIDHCVANMVYSKTDEEFQSHADEFKLLACRGGRGALWTYFSKNWSAKKDMWVKAFRMNLPHFRNNTNNRLENFFGKLKADLDGSFSMKDCLQAILNFQRRKEDEYHSKVMMPGSVRNANYGEEMNQFLGMTSDWLAEIFFVEYQFSTDPETMPHYTFEERQHLVHVSREGRIHRVDAESWLCDCEFSSTMKLPCRHVMLYRKHLGNVFTIPYSSIHSRWLRTSALDDEIAKIEVPIRVSTCRDDVKIKKQMTERDKYKHAQEVFSRITMELTDFPDAKFETAMQHLEGWWKNLRQGSLSLPGQPLQLGSDEELAPTQVAAATAVEGEVKDEHAHDDSENDADGELKLKPFNPRAPKSGRPKKNRAAADSKRSADRKEYNQGSNLRKRLRAKDVVEIKCYLETNRPPLSEVASFLNTFEVRFRGCNKKKITATMSTSEPDPTPMPFRLPEAMVTTALRKAVEIEAEMEGAQMEVDLCSPVQGSSRGNADTQWCTVHIDGAGEFSKDRLEAMKYLWNMVNTCSRGMQCYSWLMSEVYVNFSQEAEEVASKMTNAWPQDTIPGFSFDVHWANTYCVRPGVWFNDIIIQAFLETLSHKYKKSKTIFLPQLSNPAPGKGKRIPQATLTALETTSEDLVFMPVNLNSSHWACILVDMTKGVLLCYDSVDSRPHHKLLSELASEMIARSLTGFTQIAVHNPLQKDSDNCGLFVCIFFWKRLWKDVGSDYTEKGLARRRWHILDAVVNFDKEKNEDASN